MQMRQRINREKRLCGLPELRKEKTMSILDLQTKIRQAMEKKKDICLLDKSGDGKNEMIISNGETYEEILSGVLLGHELTELPDSWQIKLLTYDEVGEYLKL